MITALHALIYSDDPAATRRFLADVLDWPHVEDSASEPGWLIFRSGPSEMGVHPTGSFPGGSLDSRLRHHEVSLMCDDIASTRTELEARGATFLGETEDEGWGLVAMLELPGADPIRLYQPSHPVAHNL